MFEIVKERSLASVAFPSISTGAYGFPVDRASRIAVREMTDFLTRSPSTELVLVVCFSARDVAHYEQALRELG